MILCTLCLAANSAAAHEHSLAMCEANFHHLWRLDVILRRLNAEASERRDGQVKAVDRVGKQEKASQMGRQGTSNRPEPRHVRAGWFRHRAIVMPLSMLLFVGACQSLKTEEGFLPDALRSAGAVIQPGDYPDLRKIPDPPKDLPTQKAWADLQDGLTRDGQAVDARPGAGPITKAEADQSWAAAAKALVDANPASAPTMLNDAQSEAWAEEARAKMEADLARLPPT